MAEKWTAFGEQAFVVGFDPDREECARLEREYGNERIRFIPMALGERQGRGKVYVTRDPACSSLYEPDDAVESVHPDLEGLITLERTTEVELSTLDGWIADNPIPEVRVLKVDVQGGELGVLRGADEALKSARLLEVEVQFNPLYRGVPLFGEVDAHLRGCGFVLWRLHHLVHYGLRGGSTEFVVQDWSAFDSDMARIEARGGQLYWADAVYVRHEVAIGSKDRSAQIALLDGCICAASGYSDLAESSFAHAAERFGEGSAKRAALGALESVSSGTSPG
jgi:FkbM family methyltransferase